MFCSTAASCSWSNHKTAGTSFFGHMKSVQHVMLIGMAGWWFVFVLQPSDLDTLQSLSELGWNWVMQQDNDQKHSSKSKNKKTKNRKWWWLRQSPDLIPTEMLWWDLRRTLHKWTPANLRTELKQRCKNKWAKIPSQWGREWKSYRKQILHIVAAKSGSISYWNGVYVVFEQTGI